MRLHQIKTSMLRELKQPVNEIRAIKLYYWYRGRNAWWGTWATHYFEGSIHTTSESAKQFVEAQRTQGSVFYLRQLPALHLVAGRWSVAITQINSLHPLCEYTYVPMPQRQGIGCRRDLSAKSAALGLGAPVDSVVESFEPLSSFWFKTPKTKNSVVSVCAYGGTTRFEELNDEELLQWKSIAMRKNYQLDWSVPSPSGVSTKAVRNLEILANS